jgi:hypothetical protein
MPFEGLEAMTNIALVPLEGLHELLMGVENETCKIPDKFRNMV